MSGGLTDPRSTLPLRPSCCGTRARAVCARRRSTRVLAAAEHGAAKRPRELPAGLTDRELEVLLALAAGKTNKEIAQTLGTAKTVGHDVQHRSSRRPGRGEPGPPRRSGRSSATNSA